VGDVLQRHKGDLETDEEAAGHCASNLGSILHTCSILGARITFGRWATSALAAVQRDSL